ADDINAAAKAYAQAENGIILFGHEAGNDPPCGQLSKPWRLVTDHAGRPNNGVIAVLPHANSRGAADMGVVPDRAPGYRPVEQPGLSAQEMLGGAEGNKVMGMLIADYNDRAQSFTPRALTLYTGIATRSPPR
ncbi:MAG: hypothetical protein HC832_07295, partial [Leptolyngbyaceae cyanobacterium RM1_405_57]|nr:hypothetical protein [Leptolyngbyaceae cyanobacterium RM1_405_57]